MKTYSFLILALILFCASCSMRSSQTRARLEHIDSLIVGGMFEDADSELAEFDADNITDEDGRALYSLMKAQMSLVSGRGLASDSLLTYAVGHYERSGDVARLARALYYEGEYEFEKGNPEKALAYMKKAERWEREADVSWLRFMIYVNMSNVNTLLGAGQTALGYARKTLAHAVRHGDKAWMCAAYNSLAACYNLIGKKDSALIYVEKIIPYIGTAADRTDSVGYLCNVGYLYYELGVYDRAETMLREAVALMDVNEAVVNLIMTLYMKGEDAEADSLRQIRWSGFTAAQKGELLQLMAELAERGGDFETSARYYREAKAMTDSAAACVKTEAAVVIQNDSEMDMYRRDVAHGRNVYVISTVACVVLLLLIIGLAYWRSVNKARRTIAEADRLIAGYEAKVEALEQSDRRHSSEIDKLKRKIEKFKDERKAMLVNGQTLYENIINGGTTATWVKKDFNDIIEYYRTMHPRMVAEAENDYVKLSLTNIFYLILIDMGHSDADVQRIMCMSPGAVRTMKSRVKAKRKA